MRNRDIQILIASINRDYHTLRRRRQEYERLTIDLMKAGQSFFDQFNVTSLWLACHRLKEKGRIRETLVANCFELV